MSQEFLKVIYDAPIMWRRINSIGIILDCNTAYAQKLGYAKSEVIGKTIFEHVPASEREAMHESLKAWFETGEVEGNKLTFKKHNGVEFEVVLDATSIYDSEGNLLGSNTVIFDTSDTDQKVIKGFLINAKDKLDTMMSSYDSFDDNTKREFDGMKKMIGNLLAKNQ